MITYTQTRRYKAKTASGGKVIYVFGFNDMFADIICTRTYSDKSGYITHSETLPAEKKHIDFCENSLAYERA